MTTTQQAGPGAGEPPPTSVRPTHGAETALRLTVLGASGRVDLAVPMGLDVASLAREYADLVGLSAAPALARAGGRALPPDATLEQVLEQGDLVVVAATGTGRTAGPSEPAAAVAGGQRRVSGRV